MKTNTLKRNKSKLPGANNRHVIFQGQKYVIRCQNLGFMALADAEPVNGGNIINLFDKTEIARGIRSMVETGRYS